MAVLGMVSAEHVATADLTLLIGASSGSQVTVASSGGVVGNYVQLASNERFNVSWADTGAGYASFWGHFSLNAVSAQSTLVVMSFGERVYQHVAFRFSGTNPVYLNAWNTTASWPTNTTGSGVLLGSGSIPLTLGVWYAVEFEITFDASAGVVKTWINGAADLNLTGQDTYNAGAAEFTTLQVNGTSLRIDNLVVGSTESPNSARLGEVRIDCHFPVSPNGSDSEWTRSAGDDNWTLVDETAASVGTGDYIASTAVGDQTSFHVEALKASGGTMYAVQATAYLTKMNAGPAGIKPYVLRSGTRYYGPEWHPSFGSWEFFSHVWDQDPAAGPGAWTETNFNNSEFGLERTT